jgi:hypothetical protein
MKLLLDSLSFLLAQHTKMLKTYQMIREYTKGLKMLPNGNKIHHHFPFQGPLKCTQVGIFGMEL